MTTPTEPTFKFAEGEMITVNEATSPYYHAQGQIIKVADPYTVKLFNAEETVTTFKQGQLNSRYADTERGQKNRQIDLLNYQASKMSVEADRLTTELNTEGNLDNLKVCIEHAKNNSVDISVITSLVEEVYQDPA